MLGTPVQESFISYWLPLGTLTLVVRADSLTKVLAVGEVEGNVVGIKPLLEAFKFPFKDVQHNTEVTSDCNEVIAPIKFRLC